MIKAMSDKQVKSERKKIARDYFNDSGGHRVIEMLLNHPDRNLIEECCLHILGDEAQIQENALTEDAPRASELMRWLYGMDYTLAGHKCEKIAEIDTNLPDREIWIGELTEQYEKAPKETHCIHIKTPFKEIVLGVNSSDAWWLVAFGQMLLDEDGKKLIKSIQIEHYIKMIKENAV